MGYPLSLYPEFILLHACFVGTEGLLGLGPFEPQIPLGTLKLFIILIQPPVLIVYVLNPCRQRVLLAGVRVQLEGLVELMAFQAAAYCFSIIGIPIASFLSESRPVTVPDLPPLPHLPWVIIKTIVPVTGTPRIVEDHRVPHDFLIKILIGSVAHQAAVITLPRVESLPVLQLDKKLKRGITLQH